MKNRITILLIISALYSTAINAQELSSALCLKEMGDAATMAIQASAKVLSNKTFNKALKAQEKAETQSRSEKYICQNALRATEYFKSATEIAKLAQNTLKEAIEMRRNAINVKGHTMHPKEWSKVERMFVLATKSVENGNLDKAKDLNKEASAGFDNIELLSIKDVYLNQAKLSIIAAEEEKAARYAPITLNQAYTFLDIADKELNSNRYNNESARNNANNSIERSNHAIFLSRLIQSVQDKVISTEELIIQSEENLKKIAHSADILPLMTDGYISLTKDLVAYIDNLRNEKQYLEQDQKDNLIQIADMEEEIRTLDKRLGGATEEREALIQRIEAQARIKEQFNRVEKMFNTDEARVFRENNNVILRLIGITFESNESKIMTKNIPLLTKVEKAIDVYPNSEIIIEGHTDSQGDDQLNQKLSQDRADAVKQYMINAMLIPSYRIIATGYGETRPIANNETELGREKNRRIDIAIRPILD